MQPRTAYLPLAIFTLGLTACGSDPGDGLLVGDVDDVGEAESAIKDGYLDNQDPHAVAIAHLSGLGFGSCSGTLISPNVVLTAQHCVAQTSGDGSVLCGQTTFSPSYPPSELYITTRVSLTQNINDYHLAREVHVAGGPGFCGNDVAVIILNDTVNPEEAEWAVPRVDTELAESEQYYAIGHGNTSDGNGGGGTPTRHRRDNLYTQCVGNACGFSSGVAASEWRGDAGVCSGDSGGGAYDLANRVHGVASRGAQGCASPVYGGVFAWGEWLKEITTYAASLAEIEPPPWATGFPTDPVFDHPVGAECTDFEDCSSSACFDGYCTRQCNELAVCPEDYECNAELWCERVPEPESLAEGSDRSNLAVSNGCSIGAPRDVSGRNAQHPGEPIPWETFVVAMGAAVLVSRRVNHRRDARKHGNS